ncbi:MAG: serine/threonine-protein kinase [Sulfuritalea sp.]|nr:serine/threonine-protein kinase [Sulfuritalea sp.]
MIAGRYEVIGDSFVGGMAAVWPCNDSILERKVAIKVMPGSVEKRRIRDELGALLKMRSNHVVQVYDVLDLNNDLAIVQEFIEGQDLFDEDLAPKNKNEYLRLLWQIASGIADIHDLGVIHRDIKPNNMKIDPEGVVKIFDFGLARDEGPSAATLGFVGTPGFAAPELYDHHVTFTAAIDTYAFGATALFLGLRDLPAELTHRPPVLSGADYFSVVPFKLAEDVVQILNACLEKVPANRPAMREVGDLLAKHLLHNKHRALIVFDGKASYLDATRPSVVLRLASIGEVGIRYDGFSFLVGSVNGEVFINNTPVAAGDHLPGACVVALGAPERQAARKYITFDLSHPEIVL